MKFASQTRRLKKLRMLKLMKLYLLVLQLPKKYRKKRFGVGNKYLNRTKYGAYYTLIPEMRQLNPNEPTYEKFFDYFRMIPSDFDDLLAMVEPFLIKNDTYRKSISPGECLAVTLRYLASGDMMTSIAYQFRLGNTTVSNIIRKCTAIIWDVLSQIVFPQYSEEKWKEIADNFEKISNFPNCIGAIDGKHIIMQALPNNGSAYLNNKGMHKVVLIAICDAEYRFIMVDIGGARRNSGGDIFKNSNFGKKYINNEKSLKLPPNATLPTSNQCVPYVLLAHEGFPLLPNMMRPYPSGNTSNNMTKANAIFNYRLSKGRRIVENAFGILSSRWRIYRRPIIAGYETVINITKATCCLHNWLIDRKNMYVTPQLVDTINSDATINEGEWRDIVRHDTGIQDIVTRVGNSPTTNGIEIRNIFKLYFLTEAM